MKRQLASRWFAGRAGWLLLTLLGALFLTITFARSGAELWPVLAPWLVSLVAAVAFVQLRSGKRLEWRFKPDRNELLLVAGLTLLAALLRLPGLERMPSGIYGDEGEFAVRALDVSQGGGPAPFGIAFFGDPALYIYLLSPFVGALGATMEAVRLPSALVGTATIPALYGLTRNLFGRRVATLAALFLATSAAHIHFSRLAVNIVWVPFFACLSLWLLKRGLDRRDDPSLLLAGIVGGLGIYTHFGARLIVPILALVLVYQFVAVPRDWRLLVRAAVLAGLGGLLSLAPLLAYMSNSPGRLTEHTERRAVWSHWEDLAERYGMKSSDKLGILVEQVRRSLGAFVTRVDPIDGAQMYTFMDAALMNRLLGMLALLGLLALCLRVRHPDARLVLIWFIVPVILASVLTDVAGQAHRLLHPLLPALIAAAFLIDWFLKLLRARVPRWVSIVATPLVVFVALAPGLVETYDYLLTDVTVELSPDGTAQARCLEALPEQTVALVAGAPRIYARHGPSRYLGHDINRLDLSDPDEDLPVNTGGYPLVILVYEGNLKMLPKIEAAYPAAESTELERPAGRRIFTVLAIPAPGHESAEPLLRACEVGNRE